MREEEEEKKEDDSELQVELPLGVSKVDLEESVEVLEKIDSNPSLTVSKNRCS